MSWDDDHNDKNIYNNDARDEFVMQRFNVIYQILYLLHVQV